MRLLGDRNPSRSRTSPTLGRGSPRRASSPARRPPGDGPPSSPAGRASLPPEPRPLSSGPRFSWDSARSAPEEVLSLEELFPLGSDASEASPVSSHLDFQLNVKSLDDLGSAPSGDAAAQPPGERDVSIQGGDYESDFESAGGTDVDHRGGGDGEQVSEHLPDEEGATSSTLSSEARTDGEDANTSTASSLGSPASGAKSSSRASSQPAARLNDAAAQTDADAWRTWAGPPDALALTESAKRRLALARRTARSGRRKRDDLVLGLGPPAYTYVTLRRTLEGIRRQTRR
ncbi:clumping factor B-like [Syngnathoides biaculeatus]|uniref:clumping factor B-like n=1 Tax=Syngnathoides biaculeatus TaxID=300417 RepID=UPI002ADE6C18|nr:clumping factor B-like [Syngnathoides biaculeatus]